MFSNLMRTLRVKMYHCVSHRVLLLDALISEHIGDLNKNLILGADNLLLDRELRDLGIYVQ